MRALIVEDNRELAAALRAALAARGIAADLAHAAADAEHQIVAADYAVVILDLGLPDEDGTALLERLRRSGRLVPVIVLTARSGIDDRVRALGAGADDYVQKPFHVDELVARIHAVLRRSEGRASNVIAAGPLRFDPVARQFAVDGRPIALAGREGELLELFLRRRDRIVPRATLEDQLFGMHAPPGSNAVEVYIHRLRAVLRRHAPTLTIATVRGIGYRLSSE